MQPTLELARTPAATTSPAANASSAAASGSSEPLPRSTRMPPIALANSPTTGASNTSFFPRKRTGRPALAKRTPTAIGSK